MSTETDPDEEMVRDSPSPKMRPKATGKASPQRCMVCGAGLESKKALVFHLK